MSSGVLLAGTSESSQSSQVGSWRAWAVCLSAALFFFYEFIQMQMFNAINTQLRADFAVNATELGLLSSTYLLVDILFLIPAGYILDRVSTRAVIIAATSVCVFGTFGFALSHHVWLAGFFHAVSGLGHAFCFLSCFMLVTRWFPARQQALLVGLVVTMAFLGGMVSQAPLALLADAIGWRPALLLDGVLGVFVVAIIYWQVYDYPEELTSSCQAQLAKNRKIPFLSSLTAAVRNLQNWTSGLYTALFNLPIMVLTAVWGGPYLQTVHGLTATQATTVTMMIFVGSMFGCPVAGWWSDSTLRRRRPMIIGGVLSMVALYLIMYGPNLNIWTMLNPVWSLMILFFTLGFSTSTQVITYPVIAESNDNSVTGLACGLAAVVIMGMGMLAQPFFGWLMDKNWSGELVDGQRIYDIAAYDSAMLLFPVAFIIGLIAVGLMRETHCRKL